MSTSGSGLESPMPPRADLNTGQVFRHRPDRPEHLQYSQHRPMPVVPPGPPLPTQPESGIPPLPRSGGQRPPGPRNRIDPNQIPSPVVVHEQDCEVFENEAFRTCQFLTSKNLTLAGETLSSSQVPLSLTDYVAIDEGNCTPRFIRATTYSFPETEELARAAELPLGLIVQPLAELGQGEGECVPLADFGEDPTGPPRCSGCRGYINPCCTFTDGGQRFRCNLCGKPSDVPSAYFCHLDMSGRRLDHYHRPELCRGSVDFIVNKEYWVQDESSQSRTPKPMKYLFAIDVSWSSIKSGMLKEVTRYIKRVLFEESIDNNEDDTDATGLRHSSNGFGKRKFTEGGEVGFVTFDRIVHFYNLKGGLEQAQMLVVPDLEDMFVPIGEESLFVNPQDSKVIIENLLDSLPSMFEENQIIESAIGGPVQAALSSLRKLGGQVNVFLTSLPTIGPGALKQREETKLYNTDKEHTLFNPSNPWYRQVAEECSLAGIGINLFLFPSQYIDVATLSVLSGITGGEVFFYPRFTPQRDGCKLESQIRRVLTRETACSVTMRIRCSNGVRVSEYFGSFLQRNVTDLEFGNIDSDKAIAAIVKLDGRSESKSEVHFQCALLYTSSNGQRRVRCHNLTIPVTSIMGNVFRSADMDATITAVTKQYITQASQSPLKEVRATLTESCVKVLLAYRKHCASSTSPGQLILPESFKLFPLYSLGLMKTKALKGGNVSSDVRTYYMRYLRSMGAGATLLMIYPRMVPIHQLSDEVGSINPNNGRLKLAPLMRASYLRMEPDGAYLLENGDVMLLWLGNSVSPQIINDLFGVRSLEELEPTKNYRIPRLNTKLSEQVRTLMKHYNAHKGEIGNCLMICRQNVDSSELEFANLLVEDQNNDAMSYVDYLCFVHKQIQNELSSSGGGEIKSFDNSGSNFDPSSLWRAAW
ncbi:Sec23/Sec24 trunk domain-containing protein [Phakopsora pachyrhizi]|nr:Sec23/Sec24 trunk domain-containing protein [Phakopsora pachyrhizi]